MKHTALFSATIYILFFTCVLLLLPIFGGGCVAIAAAAAIFCLRLFFDIAAISEVYAEESCVVFPVSAYTPACSPTTSVKNKTRSNSLRGVQIPTTTKKDIMPA
jgi:hypothetical protein